MFVGSLIILCQCVVVKSNVKNFVESGLFWPLLEGWGRGEREEERGRMIEEEEDKYFIFDILGLW